MRVALKMTLVFSLNTSSSSVNFEMSTLMACDDQRALSEARRHFARRGEGE
jgi:hypothetical protein